MTGEEVAGEAKESKSVVSDMEMGSPPGGSAVEGDGAKLS
jgi:hypothetical protein